MGKLLNIKQPVRSESSAISSIAEEEERGMQLQRQIGRNLTRCRDMRGLSVDSLAQQSGVDPAALRAAESGEAMPSLGLLWKVARRLNVSCLVLTGEQEEPQGISRRPDGRFIRSFAGSTRP